MPSHAPDDVYWNERKECFNQYVYRLFKTHQTHSTQFKNLKIIYGLRELQRIASIWEERHECEKPYRKG